LAGREKGRFELTNDLRFIRQGFWPIELPFEVTNTHTFATIRARKSQIGRRNIRSTCK
jgi:hypothetical protein